MFLTTKFLPHFLTFSQAPSKIPHHINPYTIFHETSDETNFKFRTSRQSQPVKRTRPLDSTASYQLNGRMRRELARYIFTQYNDANKEYTTLKLSYQRLNCFGSGLNCVACRSDFWNVRNDVRSQRTQSVLCHTEEGTRLNI